MTCVFLLFYKPTRKTAFIVATLFHGMTWFLFNIGMFPWVMNLGIL
ncbi:MAG: HTTM domain-containing protein, partial [Anaerolineae bacterium]|nr:HTTM domain-containing protein [Anaerolineae bacterium]